MMISETMVYCLSNCCDFVEFTFEPKPAERLAEDLGILRTQ